VIPLHGLSQFDPTANFVQWHFQEDDLEAWREELAYGTMSWRTL